jgi:hypothetical protein
MVILQKLRKFWYVANCPMDIGFATKKSWPTKNQWGYSHMYYDGDHYAFHCGPFYACISC